MSLGTGETAPKDEPVQQAPEAAPTDAQIIAQASSQMISNVGGPNRAVPDLIER